VLFKKHANKLTTAKDMEARQRRMSYGAQVKNRNARSGATKTRFGDVGRNIDAESEKVKFQEHGFVKQPKRVEEQRAKESDDIRKELDDIKSDEEKEVDKTDFKKEEARPTERQAAATTSSKPVSQHKVGGVFSKTWTISDHVTLPQVIEPKKSTYLPNFIAATVIITAIESCVDGDEELKWVSPFYFSLPARIYWAILFYVQILKAKEAAKKLTKAEGTWFRAFKRVYPLESLPVAGPLVPYYTNIVSVNPNDDKYDFVYPDYVKNFGISVEKGVPKVLDTFFLQPNILLLTEFLSQFTRMRTADLDETWQTGELRFFDDSGSFIPNRIGQAFQFAGIDYPAVLTVPTATTLSGVDLDKPLPETQDRLKEILSYWKKAKVADIPQAGATDPYDGIASASRMIDDFDWFEDCVEMATIQCEFFSDSINMSQIPATGGSEALIGAHITGKKKVYKAAKSWYPRNWTSLKSQFRTTRADTTYEQIFNAAYALTNATISWESNGHPIGGRQVGHRTGPYWRNREFQFVQTEDVEVQRRTLTMIRSLFFEAHGKANN
jgi:hypothetical protein